MHVENWALLIPNISSGIYAKMAYGVEQVARERGVNLIFCSFGQDLEKQNEYIQRLMLNRVSGFIIVPAVTHNVQENIVTYSSLLHAHIPFVFCNRDVEGIPAPVIKSNDFYGGYIGTKYLLERNYRKIVYLAPQRYRTSCERCQGYISALLEKGVEIDRSQILISERDTPQMSAEALLHKIEQGDEVDAVFCFDDETALYATRALQDKGIRIPQQIALIGYNNTDVCHTTEPQLTSIAYKSEDIGRMAAHVLSKMIDGHEVPQFSYYLVNPVIIERGSC